MSTLHLLALSHPISTSPEPLGSSHPAGYPPGWNGRATKPPMGWRSWNAWGARVSQDNFQASLDALAANIWTVDGVANVSLLDVGYASAGIDEGWEGCGQGVNGTHDTRNPNNPNPFRT